MNKKLILLVLTIGFMRPIGCYAADYTGGMTELLDAINSPSSSNSFTASSAVTLTQNLTPIAAPNSTLTINGNNKAILGANSYSGFTVNSGQTLNINNLAAFVQLLSNSGGSAIVNNGNLNATNVTFSANKSSAGNGGVLYNTGNAVFTNCQITGNSATSGLGGGIYNKGTVTFQAINTPAIFGGNSSSIGSDSVYMAKQNETTGSVLNINSVNSGGVSVYDAISSDSILNTINVNKPDTITTGVTNYGTTGFYGVSNATINLYNGDTVFNYPNLSGVNLNIYENANIPASTTFVINNSTVTGYGTRSNAAIVASSDITNTTFQDFKSTGDGSVYNSGDIVMNGGSFQNNSANNGGAFYIKDGGYSDLTDVSFSNNTATNKGGALYVGTGAMLNVYATSKDVLYSNNSATNGGNDIYAAGNIMLRAADGRSITFKDGIEGVSSNQLSTQDVGTYNINNLKNIKIGSYQGTLNLTGLVSNVTSQNNTTFNLLANNSITKYTDTNVSESWISSPISNVGSLNLVATNNGEIDIEKNSAIKYSGAIYNTGTLDIAASGNSVINIDNNTSTGTTGASGAISNIGGIVNISSDNSQVNFHDNKISSVFNDVYMAKADVAIGSTMNLNVGNGGSITFGSGITSDSVLNSINVNDSTYSALTDGTVNFNCNLSDLTINIKNGTTNFGSGHVISDDKINIFGGNQTFNNSTFQNNSQLVVNNPTASNSTNIESSNFIGLGYTMTDPIIKVIAGTLTLDKPMISGFTTNNNLITNSGNLTIIDPSISNNTTTNSIIDNSGTLNLSAKTQNSQISQNTASTGNGCVINNTGTVNISSDNLLFYFTSNTATAGLGGAIYNNGIVNIQSTGSNSDVLFGANTDGSVAHSNDIYMAKVSDTQGAVLNLKTNDSGQIHFYSGIASDSILNTININKDNVNSSGDIGFYGVTSNLTINAYNGNINFINDLKNDTVNIYSGATIANAMYLNFENSTINGFGVRSGAAITNASFANFTNNIFQNFTSTGNGSVINTSQFTANGGSFQNNIANNGGAVYVKALGNAQFTDVSFLNNSANKQGGALYLDTDSLAYIYATSKDVLFDGNKATNGGSDIYSNGAKIFLNAANGRSITFNDGIEGSLTNSIYTQVGTGSYNFNNLKNIILYNASGTVNLTGTISGVHANVYSGSTGFNVLANNSLTTWTNSSNYDSGSCGGAIFNPNNNLNITATNHGEIDINNNTVSDLSYGGAAIVSFGDDTKAVNISASNDSKIQIDNNKATLSIAASTPAGAVYNEGILNINASNNSSIEFKGNEVNNGAGGAIYNSKKVNITADNSSVVFSENKASNVGNDIYLATWQLTHASTLNLNAGNGGTINFGSGIASSSQDNTVNINDSAISPLTNGTVNLNCPVSNLTMNIKAGTTNFGTGSVIDNSVVKVLGGTQNFNSTTIQDNAKLVVNDATAKNSTNLSLVNVVGSSYTTTDPAINVTAGNLNVSNSNISGFTVCNNIISNSGNLNIDSTTVANNKSVNASILNSGNANISNTNFMSNTSTTGNGGAVDNEDSMIISNCNFVNNTASVGKGGAIYNNGTLNVVANNGGSTTFSGNKSGDQSNAIYLATGSTLNLNTANSSAIVFNDKIASDPANTAININKVNASLPTAGTVKFNNAVSATNINLYGGTLALGNENVLNGQTLNVNGDSQLSLINGSIGTASLNTINVAANKTANVGIDVNLANQTSDKLSASSVNLGTGAHLSINAINILTDSKAASSTVNVVDQNIANYVTSGVTTVMGPIFKYNVNYDASNGTMAFGGISNGNYTDYNPSVLSKTISSLTGTYLNQVNLYSEALGRAESFMSMPWMDRMLMKSQNKYAYAGNEPMIFSPLATPDEQGGLWFKQYTTFENVPLNNGPSVSNVSYGSLVGGDTPMKHLGHGYDGYLTAYVGYNGSHQNYDRVGIYQNGGVLGLSGTVYKGNFFGILTANVGATNANASTMFGNDNFTTLLAGVAGKVGYNIELMKGKFIIQPTYSMAYTFANTFDYTSSSGVDITSQPLNAIQIEPGVKFIANMEHGWQPYLALNMVWNLMDGQKFWADTVQLPTMSIDPYVEYGLGVQRRWGERFSGFAQTMLRGGGRNGIAIQFGFRLAIGK